MKTKVFPPLLLAFVALLAWCAPEAKAQFTASSKLGSGATGAIVTNAAGSYSVLAGGQDIFGAGDQFTFHNFSSQGSQFDLRVRVQSLEANARLTRAGLMVRQSLTTNSRMAFVRVTPAGPALNGETGANDVYIVDSPEYGEVLIPVTPETIIKTDIDAGVVIVKLPEGLIP